MFSGYSDDWLQPFIIDNKNFTAQKVEFTVKDSEANIAAAMKREIDAAAHRNESPTDK